MRTYTHTRTRIRIRIYMHTDFQICTRTPPPPLKTHSCDATGSTLFLVVVLLLFSGRQPAVHAPLHFARQPVEELAKDLMEVEALLAISEVRLCVWMGERACGCGLGCCEHISIYIYMWACEFLYIYLYVYIHIYAYVSMCIYICVYV